MKVLVIAILALSLIFIAATEQARENISGIQKTIEEADQQGRTLRLSFARELGYLTYGHGYGYPYAYGYGLHAHGLGVAGHPGAATSFVARSPQGLCTPGKGKKQCALKHKKSNNLNKNYHVMILRNDMSFVTKGMLKIHKCHFIFDEDMNLEVEIFNESNSFLMEKPTSVGTSIENIINGFSYTVDLLEHGTRNKDGMNISSAKALDVLSNFYAPNMRITMEVEMKIKNNANVDGGEGERRALVNQTSATKILVVLKDFLLPKSFIYQPEQVEQWNDYWKNFIKLYKMIIKHYKSEKKIQSTIKNYNFLVDLLTRMNLLNHILDNPEIPGNFSVKASHGNSSVTKALFQLKNLIVELDYNSASGETVKTRIGSVDPELQFSELKVSIGLERLE